MRSYAPGDMFGEYEALYTPVHIFSTIALCPCETYALSKPVRTLTLIDMCRHTLS